MTAYTPARWWIGRSQARQNYAPQPRKAVVPATFTPPVIEANPAESAVRIYPEPGNRTPELMKIIRRLQSGARIEQTTRGYRLTDKGRRKVKQHIFKWLCDHDFILKHITGQYAPTFKAHQWMTASA